MTARLARILSSLSVVLVATACTNYFEIPIETPIRPTLDVSAFQRVLVAGFVSGGTEDVDGNLETTRLLRSQLRTKSSLRVIDSDALPLTTVVAEAQGESSGQPPVIKEEKDLEAYSNLFANVDYWKKIGEEYQQPLIVTGTVLFTPHQRNSIVQREEEVYDSFGRAKGVRAEPAVRVHRRSDRNRHALDDRPRGDSLQREPDDTGAVVLFRVDGPRAADLPEHAEQPEDQGHPHSSAVATGFRVAGSAPVC
jgi:hypothetical protein